MKPESKNPKIGPDFIIGQKYQIIKSIGKGSFGEVFLGFDRTNRTKVAIKVEELVEGYSQLSFESKVYKYLSDGVNISSARLYQVDVNRRALVMELRGPSLEELHKRCRSKFTLKTVCLLADQMVSILEYLHLRSIIHRDLKPDNFLMGLTDCNKVYVVDFGLSKQYAVSRIIPHVKYNTNKNMIGTVRYASINSHLGIEQSRRDDLEALGYVLLYLYLGKLPWQGVVCDDKKRKYNIICERKLSMTLDGLCRQSPQQFRDYMHYVYHLRFDQKPDYMYLRQLFRQVLQFNNLRLDNVFDWSYNSDAKLLFTRYEKIKIPPCGPAIDGVNNSQVPQDRAQLKDNEIGVPELPKLRFSDGNGQHTSAVAQGPTIHRVSRGKDPKLDSKEKSSNLNNDDSAYVLNNITPSPRYNLRSYKRDEQLSVTQQQPSYSSRRKDQLQNPQCAKPI